MRSAVSPICFSLLFAFELEPTMQQFVLPDLFALCPLEGSTNPHFQAAAAESRAWINSFDVFKDERRAYFIQGSNELLASHAYPYAGYEQFRTCCDFVNLLFIIDEVSDDQNGKDARTTGMVYLNVMRDPKWDDGSILARMTREFRARFTRLASPACQRRFLQHCEDYIEAIVKEAEYRERGTILNIAAFERLRRDNSAVPHCFGLIEYALGIDLPDQVFNSPVFMSLYWAAVDMVCWSNDVYSYTMEQSKGLGGNNILTVLQKAKGIDLQAASDHVGIHFKKLMDRFVADKERLHSWGPRVDSAVARYVAAMEHWVIGNLEWSFESKRYFGAATAQVKRTRVVTLRREQHR